MTEIESPPSLKLAAARGVAGAGDGESTVATLATLEQFTKNKLILQPDILYI